MSDFFLLFDVLDLLASLRATYVLTKGSECSSQPAQSCVTKRLDSRVLPSMVTVQRSASRHSLCCNMLIAGHSLSLSHASIHTALFCITLIQNRSRMTLSTSTSSVYRQHQPFVEAN